MLAVALPIMVDNTRLISVAACNCPPHSHVQSFILLYPSSVAAFDQGVRPHGYRVRVPTLDLTVAPQDIHKQLIRLSRPLPRIGHYCLNLAAPNPSNGQTAALAPRLCERRYFLSAAVQCCTSSTAGGGPVG